MNGSLQDPDFIEEPCRNRMLPGPITFDPRQAHHILSWNLQNNPVIQRAARATDPPFHMNLPKNGAPVEAWRNSNHPAYDDLIEEGLQRIETKLGGNIANVDPNLVSMELIKFQTYLKNLIDESPNTALNDLIFHYVP